MTGAQPVTLVLEEMSTALTLECLAQSIALKINAAQLRHITTALLTRKTYQLYILYVYHSLNVHCPPSLYIDFQVEVFVIVMTMVTHFPVLETLVPGTLAPVVMDSKYKNVYV